MLLPAMSACTLTQLNQQVDAGQARVDAKQQELDVEQARQAALHQEMLGLSAELNQRQLSLAELNARLERLRQQNARAAEATAAQQARKRQVQAQIKSYQDQIGALQRNPTLSDDEKRKLSAHLQDEIRKALQQMVLS
jgi:chromosome segregation ATPase